ncbi:protein UPSTREAM OF FLC-like isoform X2 [Ananas comosus]|uniref:Protein UPSTREAM OF FLC-like isoform X2 n=1 Tax=Ananas comosus TaxID=4615 RepID=A0A6P5G9Q1_ANACO|nr:protein UPSTREAM OF FLC-like isoform X2 [Ananas comosus]
MASASASRGSAELPGDQRERAEASPERAKVWIEPKPPRRSSDKKKAVAVAAVVYYLSRNNHLEHPHYMEVTYSSDEGLFLRDFINRLNVLRGQWLGAMYSWSSKRAYKNGYVWHDLSDDDLIPPIHSNEYVLKGTELVPTAASSSVTATASSSSSSEKPLDASKSIRGDLGFHNSRKTDTVPNSRGLTAETAVGSADASTQTEERPPWRAREDCIADYSNCRAELRREEISPPPCLSSSPEALPPPLKTASSTARVDGDRTAGGCLSGRFRASTVLMNLIPCSSVSVKEAVNNIPASSVEYYGGSSIEAKSIGENGAGELSLLKRSSSCNVNSGVKLEFCKGTEGADAGCMPRKPRTTKEGYIPIARSANVGERFTR